MALAVWQANVLDAAGNVVPLTNIEVRRDVPGQPLIQLYSDRDGTIPLGNPFLADATGFVRFFVDGGAYQIRAYVGSPSSPLFERIWRYTAIGTTAETDIEDLQATILAGTIYKDTKANLDLVDPTDENSGGVVLNDPDPTKNGFYTRAAGVWVKRKGLYDSLAEITVIGGTANAVQASTDGTVNPADVVLLFGYIATTNDDPVTLALNGAAAQPVVSPSGDPMPDGVFNGAVLLAVRTGFYQLINDAASVAAAAATLAAVQILRDETEDFRDEAQAAAGTTLSPIYRTKSAVEALTVPLAHDKILLQGNGAVDDGGDQWMRRQGSDPVTPFSVQDAVGIWFKTSVDWLTVEMAVENAGNGIVDCTAAVQAMGDMQGMARFRRGGTYKMDNLVAFTGKKIQWEFEEGALLDFSALTGSAGTAALTIQGSAGASVPTTLNMLEEGYTATISAANLTASGIVINDHIIIGSDALYANAATVGSGECEIGEHNVVIDITGSDPKTLVLLYPHRFQYDTADNARVYRTSMVEDVRIENMEIVGNNATAQILQGLRLQYLFHAEVHGIKTHDWMNAGIVGLHIPHFYSNQSFTKCSLPSTSNSTSTLYGWAIGGNSHHVRIHGHYSEGLRHHLTTTEDTSKPGQLESLEYGWFDVGGKRLNQAGGTCDAIDNHYSSSYFHAHDGIIRDATGNGMNLNGRGGVLERITVNNVGNGHAINCINLTDHDGGWDIIDCVVDGVLGGPTFGSAVNLSTDTTNFGKMLHARVKGLRARGHTGRTVTIRGIGVNLYETDVTLEGIEADCSDCEVADNIYVEKPKSIIVRSGHLWNLPPTFDGYRIDSDANIPHDIKTGPIEYDASANSSGNGVDIVGATADSQFIGSIDTEVRATATNTAAGVAMSGNFYGAHISVSGNSADLITGGAINTNAGAISRVRGMAWLQNRDNSLTLLARDSGKTLTNTGASGTIAYTLPTAINSLEMEFLVTTAQILRITAATGDTIRYGGTVTAAGGSVESNDIGDSMKLVCTGTTAWMATSIVGTGWA